MECPPSQPQRYNFGFWGFVYFIAYAITAEVYLRYLYVIASLCECKLCYIRDSVNTASSVPLVLSISVSYEISSGSLFG